MRRLSEDEIQDYITYCEYHGTRRPDLTFEDGISYMLRWLHGDEALQGDVPITYHGAGVASVKSSDLLKSARVQRQIQALSDVTMEEGV
jgi:hypothetical protein